MAPDRGHRDDFHATDAFQDHAAGPGIADEALPAEDDSNKHHRDTRDATEALIAERGSQYGNLTLRGVVVGVLIGVVVNFSNVYFGLQTGWISGMAMPSALLGFGFFRALRNHLKLPFSPVENVLIQTVVQSVGVMPLGCGFVGVMPALEFLMTPEENGPLRISTGKLVLWAVGICLFGVVIAVPLRRQVIIREKLRFPTGAATALMIGVLHGEKGGATIIQQNPSESRAQNESHPDHESISEEQDLNSASRAEMLEPWPRNPVSGGSGDWKSKMRLLLIAFVCSSVYTLFSYFVPQVHALPIFGLPAARTWLWTLNPSPAYAGQGMIMGPATSAHMLIGAIIGWGILSPLAKSRGWAPGEVRDYDKGGKGWIVWVSLAIMLADAIISLGWLMGRGLVYYVQNYGSDTVKCISDGRWSDLLHLSEQHKARRGYQALDHASEDEADDDPALNRTRSVIDAPEVDAPPSQQINARVFFAGLVVAISIYFASIHITFPKLIPFTSSLIALLLAVVLSVMGIRAMGETDLNPVSGISKLTQLFFAFLIPRSNPNAITINLLAGAISEAGALQAGDLMQDLKTGHLLGASPKAQFYGQIIGSLIGAVLSAFVYRLYTHVYTVPGGQFQVPTAYVWIFTARLVTGDGLPPMVAAFAVAFAALFAALTVVRTLARDRPWQAYVPGGIAVAIGMYNEPSFTLARVVGGAIAWWWIRWRGKEETTIVLLASGLILGEGLFSIANLLLASLKVPHLGD